MPRCRGFSLIELCLVLLILGLGYVFVVPNLSGKISQTDAQHVQAAIEHAILESQLLALEHKVPIQICAGLAGECGNWHAGFRIQTEAMVFKTVTFAPNTHLVFNGFGYSDRLVFYPHNQNTNGTFTINDVTKIILTKKGQIRIENPAALL